MALKEDILQFLADNKAQFIVDYDLTKIGLLGSHSRHTPTDNSDIDIIIEFEPRTRDLSVKKAELRAAIKSKFHTEIGICREKYIKPYFRELILDSAIYV